MISLSAICADEGIIAAASPAAASPAAASPAAASPAAASPAAASPDAASPAAASPTAARVVAATAAAAPRPRRKSPPSRSSSPTIPPKLSLAMSTIFSKDIGPNCNGVCAKVARFHKCVICRVKIKGSDAFTCYLCKLDQAEQRVEELEKLAYPSEAAFPVSPSSRFLPAPSTPPSSLSL